MLSGLSILIFVDVFLIMVLIIVGLNCGFENIYLVSWLFSVFLMVISVLVFGFCLGFIVKWFRLFNVKCCLK